MKCGLQTWRNWVERMTQIKKIVRFGAENIYNIKYDLWMVDFMNVIGTRIKYFLLNLVENVWHSWNSDKIWPIFTKIKRYCRLNGLSKYFIRCFSQLHLKNGQHKTNSNRSAIMHLSLYARVHLFIGHIVRFFPLFLVFFHWNEIGFYPLFERLFQKFSYWRLFKQVKPILLNIEMCFKGELHAIKQNRTDLE